MLLLLGLVAFLGQGTLSLLHSLLFAFVLEATLLVLGPLLSLLFKLFNSRLIEQGSALTAFYRMMAVILRSSRDRLQASPS